MRALVCSRLGPPEALEIAELPDPVPGRGEVVIDVEAAGLNFPDTLMIEGKYQIRPELPFVPGGEAVGTVSALGEAARGARIGDRVIAIAPYGAFAEKWLVPASSIVRMPPGLDPLTAAGFGLTYATAYYALEQRAVIRPGETLLVLGAGGGVGSAAVELGKVLKARVIAAASTEEKLAYARRLGADHTIDYATEDLRARIADLSGGRGVDVVLDPVGGTLSEAALRSTAFNGRLLVVGFASGEIPSIPLNLVLLKGVSVVGVFWGRWVGEQPEGAAGNFEDLAEMVRRGDIQPRVNRVFALDEYAEALGMFGARTMIGKAVFRIR